MANNIQWEWDKLTHMPNLTVKVNSNLTDLSKWANLRKQWFPVEELELHALAQIVINKSLVFVKLVSQINKLLSWSSY